MGTLTGCHFYDELYFNSSVLFLFVNSLTVACFHITCCVYSSKMHISTDVEFVDLDYL